MCGLAGVWSPEPMADGDAVAANLHGMIATLRHRGPDGNRVWSDGRVGLAHARLAVIDLSQAASQPIADADGVITVKLGVVGPMTGPASLYYKYMEQDLETFGDTFEDKYGVRFEDGDLPDTEPLEAEPEAVADPSTELKTLLK